MTEDQARRRLVAMLANFTPGSVCHLLAQAIREAERTRLGDLDAAALERLRDVEGAMFVLGIGLDAVCPR
jgi:hypothetical protein